MSNARNISALSTVEVGATADQTKSDIEGLAIDVASAQLPAGSVLQVVQATSNSTTEPNTSWTVISGSSISITPSSTSSKVLINFSAGGMTNGVPDNISLRLKRGSTVVRAMSRYGYQSISGWVPIPMSLSYLDSPATSSSVTYTIETKTDTDNDYRINNDQSSNGGVNGLVMIAMEIGG